MTDSHPHVPDDVLLFEIVERFLRNPNSTEKIARDLNRIFGSSLTREAIYPALRKAVRHKLLWLSPPSDKVLRGQLAARRNQGEITVVNTIGPLATEGVPCAAASLVLDLIKQLGKERGGGPVHIGLGIGWSTMRFSKLLGALVRDDTKAPPLAIHALATAYSFWSPLETPVASFAYFADAYRPVQGFYGLFALPYVSCSEYERHLEVEIVKQAFERRDEVDIVVTSLAGVDTCPHGYLRKYLHEYSSSSIPALGKRGWKGDVQLRPYSDGGPLSFDPDMAKPVTLFELEDLVRLVERGKYVVLLCGPCGRCFRSKASALAPLLDQPALKVWSHLVVDYGTAFHLITGTEHPALAGLINGLKGSEVGLEEERPRRGRAHSRSSSGRLPKTSSAQSAKGTT